MLLYRHGLLLAGAESHAAQCEALLRSALESVRALLSILPVRAVGGEIGRSVARRHHARDARPGMSLRLAGPLLLVGAGKMGGALLEGWLRQGLDPAHVFVSDPAPPEDVAALIAGHGIERRARRSPLPSSSPSSLSSLTRPSKCSRRRSAREPSCSRSPQGGRLPSHAQPAEGHGNREGDAEHRRRYRPQHDSRLRQRCGVARPSA